LNPGEEITQQGSMDASVAHHAPFAYLVPPRLELRFDQGNDAPLPP
jgi:hypothetical protein